MSGRDRVLVVGGGPGGLAAAIALRQAGFEAVVFERARELREAGSGVGIQSNAVRVLQKLGVADPLLQISPVIESQEIYSWRGKLLAVLPVGEVAREFGTPSLAVHRADLQRVLLGGLDPGVIHLGAELVRFEQDPKGVTACFSDGREEPGAVLIGGDGMRSVVRKQLLGDGGPKYAGHFSWRGVTVPDRELFPPSTLRFFAGRGAFFGMFNLGLGRIYWTGQKQAPEGSRDAPEGRRQEALEHFKGFAEPIEELIAATDETEILRHDVYDRDPDTHWGKGRVTLLGDAAHLTTPNLGQGAGIAIEDGLVLARCLAGAGDLSDPQAVETALKAYEEQRLPRTSQIIRASRQLGETYTWKDPFRSFIRDTVVRLTPARVWRQRLVDSLAYEA